MKKKLKEKYPNIVEALFGKPTANSTLKGERLKMFPLKFYEEKK
jgi:hypothetical protein